MLYVESEYDLPVYIIYFSINLILFILSFTLFRIYLKLYGKSNHPLILLILVKFIIEFFYNLSTFISSTLFVSDRLFNSSTHNLKYPQLWELFSLFSTLFNSFSLLSNISKLKILISMKIIFSQKKNVF